MIWIENGMNRFSSALGLTPAGIASYCFLATIMFCLLLCGFETLQMFEESSERISTTTLYVGVCLIYIFTTKIIIDYGDMQQRIVWPVYCFTMGTPSISNILFILADDQVKIDGVACTQGVLIGFFAYNLYRYSQKISAHDKNTRDKGHLPVARGDFLGKLLFFILSLLSISILVLVMGWIGKLHLIFTMGLTVAGEIQILLCLAIGVVFLMCKPRTPQKNTDKKKISQFWLAQGG